MVSLIPTADQIFFQHSTTSSITISLDDCNTLTRPATFPNWMRLMREDSQHTCPVFTSVMKHLITWYDPPATYGCGNLSGPDVRFDNRSSFMTTKELCSIIQEWSRG
jgi:hypothetical protein